MNDQKDFNDVCILQTRAALKHLPTEMTGMLWFKLAMFLRLWQYYLHMYVTSVIVTDVMTFRPHPHYTRSIYKGRFHSEDAS